jgi:hypothetical protein
MWICGVSEFVGELFVVVVVVDITITIVDIAINPFLFPKKKTCKDQGPREVLPIFSVTRNT